MTGEMGWSPRPNPDDDWGEHPGWHDAWGKYKSLSAFTEGELDVEAYVKSRGLDEVPTDRSPEGIDATDDGQLSYYYVNEGSGRTMSESELRTVDKVDLYIPELGAEEQAI